MYAIAGVSKTMAFTELPSPATHLPTLFTRTWVEGALARRVLSSYFSLEVLDVGRDAALLDFLGQALLRCGCFVIVELEWFLLLTGMWWELLVFYSLSSIKVRHTICVLSEKKTLTCGPHPPHLTSQIDLVNSNYY